MKQYTYSEARQQLATLLDEVAQYGEVKIRRRDGSVFSVRREEAAESTSPLDIPGVESISAISTEDILSALQESRDPGR
jgi:antitoxin (DNA-binding transcriptional repressor) of toxin-antitoxin stability system